MGLLDTRPKFFSAWLRVFWATLRLGVWGGAWELLKTLIEVMWDFETIKIDPRYSVYEIRDFDKIEWEPSGPGSDSHQ